MRQFDHQRLKELLEAQGVAYRSGSVSYIIRCPVCSKAKLYVRKKDGRAVCFHCQDLVQGYADRVLQTVLAIPTAELAKELFGEGGPQGTTMLALPDFVDLFGDFDRGEGEEEIDLLEIPQGTVWPFDAYPMDHSFSVRGLSYLAQRGIPLALALAVGIRYQPPTRRVLFPIVVDGLLRGWQGRYTEPTTGITADGKSYSIPKAITYGKVGGKVLMFQDSLKGAKHAILTEGPMDALKMYFMGGAVAALTKSVTAQQLGVIINAGVQELYLGLDDDAASDVARIVKTLNGSKLKLYRLMPVGGAEDLGDQSLEMARAAMEAAQPILQGQMFVYLK